MPQSPTTTLGTAASISTSVPIGPRTDGGASSLRNRPIAIETGAARSTAPNDVTTVPMIRSRAPNLFDDGVPLVRPRGSRAWKTLIAGQAPSATRQTIAATMSDAEQRRRARSGRRGRGRRGGRRDARVRGRPCRRGDRGRFHAAQHSSAVGRPRALVTTPSHAVHILCTLRAPARRETPRVISDGLRNPSSSTCRRSASRTPPSAAGVSREVVFDIDDLTVSYGKAPAVKDVSLEIHRNAITALIGPSGCGKSTVLRCLNRMNDLVPSARVDGQDPLPRGRSLRRRRRPDRGAAPDRHGLPAAEPVPEVDLRQRRVRPAHPRPEGRPRRPRRAGAARRRALGRGEEPPQEVGARPLRRPAAAALHRARDRRRSPT